MKYIPEIDGLRTIAVLPVIFYHLDFEWIPGGFLGVDVFFVISGYLITQILIRETYKETKHFFVDFYLRRARRIFPALFSVTLVTLFLSLFFLFPADLVELSNSALATLAFVSNIYYYFNTGYFDAPAESMLLLHTWSLAVEEQFYLLWPVTILMLARRSKSVNFTVILSILTVSLAASIIVTPLNSSLAFYGLPFRIFEFMFGAIICLIPRFSDGLLFRYHWISAALQVTGLCAVFFSLFVFTTESTLPGYLAVVPALGTAIFIFGVSKFPAIPHNPMRSLLMVATGKISYSLYLWHWPIITLYKIYLDGAELNDTQKFWLLSVTILASVGSYFFIEKPLRKPKMQSRSLIFSGVQGSLIVVLFVVFLKTEGLESRVPNLAQYASIETMWRWPNACNEYINLPMFERKFCTFGEPWGSAKRKVLLWGDSHASQVAPLFKVIAQEESLAFVTINGSCKPVTDGNRVLLKHKIAVRATDGCLKEVSGVLRLLEADQSINLVVLTGLWRESPYHIYSESDGEIDVTTKLELMEFGLEHNVEKLVALGVDVLLLGDIPSPGKTRLNCFSKNKLMRANTPDCSPLPLEKIQEIHGPTEQILIRIADRNDRVYSHEVISSHCNQDGCPIYINGDFIYRDTNHIRRNFSDATKNALLDSLGIRKAIDWSRYSLIRHN